jgi:hypothetical protein
VLSGRNILALEAARHNTGNTAITVPAVDIQLAADALQTATGESADTLYGAANGAAYGAVFLFPDLTPRTSRIGSYWEGLGALLATGGAALAALPSSEAERFDKAKPRGFVRLGDYKRRGFRALGYRKQ